MGLMTYREANQVLWRGVRPAHNGTQVSVRSSAAGNVSSFYTVGAGKVFYWTHYVFTLEDSVGAYTGYFYYRDAADLNPVYLAAIAVSIGDSHLLSGTLTPPLEIPALFDICVRSNNAAGTAALYIHGWEE